MSGTAAEENGIEVEVSECVVISAPGWFEREDFLKWLRTGGQPATWDAGGESTEYSDCFITFDGGSNPGDLGENYEGSNFNGGGEAAMPEDIEAAIKAALFRAGARCGVLWIKPV